MAVLFSVAPGTVVRLTTGQANLPFTASLQGWGGYTATKCIVTQISVKGRGGYQFLHTLEDFIHVYTFGDRISPFVVSGLCFQAACDAGGGSGIESAIAYYNANRIAARAEPVKLSLGATGAGTFEGFLTEGDFNLNDAEYQLGQFSFIFHAFPSSAARAGNDQRGGRLAGAANSGLASKSSSGKNGISGSGSGSSSFSSTLSTFTTVSPSVSAAISVGMPAAKSPSGFIGIITR